MVFAPSVLNVETGSQKKLDRITSGRANLVVGALEMVRDRPLWGYGSGAFTEQYRERERVSSDKVAAASHTIPLTVTAEQGVIGLVAYLALVAVSLALLFRGLRAAVASARWPGVVAVGRAGIAAAYAALLLHTLVYAAYLEDPLTWVLLAIAASLRAQPPEGSDPAGAAGSTAWTVRTLAPVSAPREPLVLPEFRPTLPDDRASPHRPARADDDRAARRRGRARAARRTGRAPARRRRHAARAP